MTSQSSELKDLSTFTGRAPVYKDSASSVQPSGALVSVSLYIMERSALRPENAAIPALLTERRPSFSAELVQPPASILSPVRVNTGCHEPPLSVEYSSKYSAPVRMLPSVLSFVTVMLPSRSGWMAVLSTVTVMVLPCSVMSKG